MYEEFDAVLLKDGRFASLVQLNGPGQFSATVSDGPKDWEIITVTDYFPEFSGAGNPCIYSFPNLGANHRKVSLDTGARSPVRLSGYLNELTFYEPNVSEL